MAQPFIPVVEYRHCASRSGPTSMIRTSEAHPRVPGLPSRSRNVLLPFHVHCSREYWCCKVSATKTVFAFILVFSLLSAFIIVLSSLSSVCDCVFHVFAWPFSSLFLLDQLPSITFLYIRKVRVSLSRAADHHVDGDIRCIGITDNDGHLKLRCAS